MASCVRGVFFWGVTGASEKFQISHIQNIWDKVTVTFSNHQHFPCILGHSVNPLALPHLNFPLPQDNDSCWWGWRWPSVVQHGAVWLQPTWSDLDLCHQPSRWSILYKEFHCNSSSACLQAVCFLFSAEYIYGVFFVTNSFLLNDSRYDVHTHVRTTPLFLGLI